ncbi:MAG TPA: TonB-dependent receptor [Opitutus sp.]|nr:TonB-dependent receptor [Opitutus sp.]
MFSSTALLRAQSANPPPAGDETIHLDTIVVTAGPSEKTAFDLAQGTSVLAGVDLHRVAQETLGATLNATAGVNSTSYGPGASRPMIRGLGGDRVRILESGVGSLDASNISPDHNTAIEPLFARRIEVLRGPTTLLYGSSAVGGVVNVIENRIPDEPVQQPVSGTIEARGFGPADETSGVVALTTGAKNFAVQIDGVQTHMGDTRIPGVARIDADAPADQPSGILPNSYIRTFSGSAGAAWFGDAGHIGAAFTDYETDYGVPVDEPISITMRQHRLDLAGDLTRGFGIFTGGRLRFGLGDYAHSEIGDHVTVNTTFHNKAWEGRLELPHAFTETLTGTFGAQAERSDFSATGEEVVTPPSLTENQAVFAVEEWKLGPVALQFGGRLERQTVTLGEVPAGLPPVAGYAATSGEKRTDSGVSGSVGAVFYPAKDWSAGLSLAYTERLPTAQERFSNGPHGGTAAWEVGTAGLGPEKSLGLDFSLRKRAGFVTGSVSAFVNRFNGFIFEQRLPDDTIPADINAEGLTVYQFTAKDAQFYGAEAEIALHLMGRRDRSVHLNFTSDFVHAEETTDSQPLPRTPPFRFGTALRYDGRRWHGGVEVRTVARQGRVAPMETTTPGYTMLNADVTCEIPLGRLRYEVFARGTNLTNQEARVHASFLKDFAPLGGRGVLAGVRMMF